MLYENSSKTWEESAENHDEDCLKTSSLNLNRKMEQRSITPYLFSFKLLS